MRAPPSADEDDATLVARCREGDPRAWEALVRRYQRLVYAVVTRAGLDQHQAADVFQTVFTRLIEHLPALRDASRLQAWVVTTARREVLLLWRRGKRSESLEARSGADEEGDGPAWDIADEGPLPDESLAHLQQLDALRRALERLDARCRELLTLCFRDDDERLPYDEIARRVGIPVGSIGPTRQRCLGKLRRLTE